MLFILNSTELSSLLIFMDSFGLGSEHFVETTVEYAEAYNRLKNYIQNPCFILPFQQFVKTNSNQEKCTGQIHKNSH